MAAIERCARAIPDRTDTSVLTHALSARTDFVDHHGRVDSCQRSSLKSIRYPASQRSGPCANQRNPKPCQPTSTVYIFHGSSLVDRCCQWTNTQFCQTTRRLLGQRVNGKEFDFQEQSILYIFDNDEATVRSGLLLLLLLLL